MSEPNYAGNIIVNLSSLPDFLRKPILKKRMVEFFSLSELERKEIVVNALEAGPTIPFPSFSKLFKTWLEILTTLPEEQRESLFLEYIDEIATSPQRVVSFNMDGIMGIFLTLEEEKINVISQAIRKSMSQLPQEKKKIVLAITPDSARKRIGV